MQQFEAKAPSHQKVLLPKILLGARKGDIMIEAKAFTKKAMLAVIKANIATLKKYIEEKDNPEIHARIHKNTEWDPDKWDRMAWSEKWAKEEVPDGMLEEFEHVFHRYYVSDGYFTEEYIENVFWKHFWEIPVLGVPFYDSVEMENGPFELQKFYGEKVQNYDLSVVRRHFFNFTGKQKGVVLFLDDRPKNFLNDAFVRGWKNGETRLIEGHEILQNPSKLIGGRPYRRILSAGKKHSR